MATSIQKRGEAFQLRIIHKLLPRAFFTTHDTREMAEKYRDQLMAQLAQNKVPAAVMSSLVQPKRENDPMVIDVLDSYVSDNKSASRTDRQMVNWLKPLFPAVRISGIDFDSAVSAIATMRTKMSLAPSTIRQRVGCLGRIWEFEIFAQTREAVIGSDAVIGHSHHSPRFTFNEIGWTYRDEYEWTGSLDLLEPL